MKVVIFAGGYGSRLGSETDTVPKPMVEIGGKPILWHVMSIYSSQGFNDFVICLGYKGHMIKRYFRDLRLLNHNIIIDFSLGGEILYEKRSVHEETWKVTLVDTGLTTLKGARLKRVEPYLGETFFLTYGDGLSDINLEALLDFHKRHGKAVTLTGVNPPSRFGEVICEGDGKVVCFSEKPQVSEGLINSGFMVVERKILENLSTEPSCDFEIGFLENLATEDEVRVYRHTGSWECMDTPRDKEHLNLLWNSGKAFWKCWDSEE
jgi:glucose-1-phosphate cytidylyltransferase